jgi:hypothetical protein
MCTVFIKPEDQNNEKLSELYHLNLLFLYICEELEKNHENPRANLSSWPIRKSASSKFKLSLSYERAAFPYHLKQVHMMTRLLICIPYLFTCISLHVLWLWPSALTFIKLFNAFWNTKTNKKKTKKQKNKKEEEEEEEEEEIVSIADNTIRHTTVSQ